MPRLIIGGRTVKGENHGEVVQKLGITAAEDAFFSLLDTVGKFEAALPSPKHFRTIIFGSARVQPGETEYEQTRELARILAERGINIVTGGGPGIMEAANRGTIEGRRHAGTFSFGLCIENLRGRNELPNTYLSRAYRHKNFFGRLHQFARLGGSGAFVVMPGGLGSDLEEAMITQLLQVGHLKATPLIEIGEMWAEKAAWRRKYMVPRFADEQDVNKNIILRPHAIDALPIILEAHARFKVQKAAG